MWSTQDLSLMAKLKVYREVALPSLLYASVTWTVYSWHAKQMNSFHVSFLRKVLHMRWAEHIPDAEILQKSGRENIHAILMRSQLRWAGHVVHMPEERLPKTQLFYNELTTGKRSVGGQKKHFKDSNKLSLKQCGINPDTWEDLALDHSA